MASAVIQQPPMAYSPHYEASGWTKPRTSPYDPHAELYEQSPFSPVASTATSPLGYTNNPSYESTILGKALSDSSFPSGPSSPTRSSYGAGIQQTMRDSCHSNRSSNSHRSGLASPRPLNPTRDIEKADAERAPRHPSSAQSRSRGYAPTTHHGRGEFEGMVLEPKALKILVCSSLHLCTDIISFLRRYVAFRSYQMFCTHTNMLHSQIYLSAFNGFISLLTLFYTLIALTIIILLSPLNLLPNRPTVRQQITSLLSPPLKIHLAFIYSSAQSEEYNVPLLILILIFSPLVSMGVAVAAWVAGAFWSFNAILGDPSGGDEGSERRRVNDGRASVIGVRGWWERWLTRALR
jgi:hypothetical protein